VRLIVSKLLLVPLDDIVVFPNMNVTLTVDVGDEERVLLVPKHDGEYAAVGTVARVTDRVKLPGGATAVAVEGLFRGVAGAAETDPQGRLFVEVEDHRDGVRPDARTRELETEYRAVVEEILELRGDDGRVQAFVRSIADPGALADTSGYSPDLSFEQKLQLLETIDVTERAWRSSSASSCSGARWTRSARSWARTTRPSSRSTGRRSPRRACPRPCASRPTRSSRGSSGWARARPSRR
jgi:ATP-dependent Lon protease